MKGRAKSEVKTYATTLRKELTVAERRLWSRLRGDQLGFRFRRQHPFAGFILDFVCLERFLVIEVDGSQHADALHYDQRRTDILTAAGFHVIRFWNNEVLDQTDSVIEAVMQALNRSARMG